ncbi:hypothetical protein CRU87_01540 [Aliarcobacter trophiarum LMG 25534]|uniref:Uncharacterized protein n=1 Tax=Aliarcobacter trophiarum LMG 25534 TaxID=1032241 RepID=A0AAD0VLD7_9BACT|nr:hypothetical protein [Aliarcobacter trophiarum]AXK48123.1 hypothetical protein ATR_0235 [Aliarcobacter trophiarum LMG 25534]RXI28390.1 hypothetical protein CRU89_00110 [Aliarcobacter trophiarum]RXJ93201.1 hypothetical protein CRU87_01540 [Aliarcobacter trophiarum LMG 25534]
MAIDLLIPFAILLILVIYLIYSRNKFEKNIINLYENKFEEWKKYSKNSEDTINNIDKKEIIALVFKENYKFSIEYFDKTLENSLKRAKFEIKQIGGKYE